MNAFEARLQKDRVFDLFCSELRIMQVNLGFKCNLSCHHCHLNCGPERVEMMEWETMERVISTADAVNPEYVDITGGAPELNTHFQRFIASLRSAGHVVQTRTNFIALLEPEIKNMPKFFKDNKVKLVGSLPCYLEENVCGQRGKGVFEKSIQAIRLLNELGYGWDPNLPLNLVFNPVGPFLPPEQKMIDDEYKRELSTCFGIHFNRLLTITNMPIGRFLEQLRKQAKVSDYFQLLEKGFNCQTVNHLMCRNQISIAWDGTLYDCDFNLALDLGLNEDLPGNISDFDLQLITHRKIRTGDHCFGCTAGFGSSCEGVIYDSDYIT